MHRPQATFGSHISRASRFRAPYLSSMASPARASIRLSTTLFSRHLAQHSASTTPAHARGALDIILQNPAILQCGKSLSNQRADEIKSFARMRSFADRVPPQISQGILVLVLGTVLLNIVLSKSDDPAVLDLLMVLKPLLGGTFALAFLGTISMVGMGEAAASRAKRSKKEE